MVTAHLDESENSDCCVVAGVIATAGRWDSFQGEWGRFLKKYGVSALHMKDFAHSKKEFKSWKGDEAKRAEFLRRAVEITCKRAMTGVGVVINRAAFKRTIAQHRDISLMYADEYSTSSLMSILLATKWAKACDLKEPINFVFDRGNKNRTAFERAYDLVRLTPELRAEGHLGALSFADDIQVSPLQAADFLAYETCKLYTDANAGVPRFRRSLRGLFGRMRYECKIPEEEGLGRLVARFDELT